MLPGARCGCQGQRSYVEEKLADKHYVHICITNVRRSLPAPDWVAVVLAILKLRLLSLDAELECAFEMKNEMYPLANIWHDHGRWCGIV